MSGGEGARPERTGGRLAGDQSEGGQKIAVENGMFKHPVNIGDLSGMNCTACHSHTRAFQHPVNLGDLSQFKCVDCHAGKNWATGN